MKKLMALIVLALFAWNIQPATAQKPGVVLGNEPGWQKIGETVASFKSQDESISVIGADEFSAIKIRVEDAPLEIDRMQVFYESGDMEEIDVKETIQAGSESKVIRLEHPDRDIQKVAFTYNTVPNAEGEKADVELYGLNPEREASEAYREEEREERRSERAERRSERAEERAERAQEDAERAEEEAERAADETEDQLEETGDAVEREADQAEENVEQGAENTESDLERAADRTGDAISEAAAKAAAEIDDAKHDTKVGPDGQDIFISDDSRYYYINDEGQRVYVTKAQLKDKPEKD